MTEDTIRTLLDGTGAAYASCWRTIVGIKTLLASPEFFQGMLQFQPTLATALCDLDRANRDLERGRDELVRRKGEMPRERFLAEIRRLGGYQEAIGQAIQMGKMLGDAFAWFFYQNELSRLWRHLEHEPVSEVPSGTGLAGELAFINNVKVVDGHLVLYHGITTSLRHGDISLIDLSTFRLTCLGELKSRETQGGELEITAHLVGPPDRPLPAILRNAPASGHPVHTLPPSMAERFRRQVDGMAAAFKPIPVREELKLEQDTGLPVLMELADELERAETVYKQWGPGLLLVGLQTGESSSLFDKLLNSKFDALAKLQGARPHVEPLIDMSQCIAADNANTFIIGTLGRATLPGAAPLFWSPLKVSFLEKLFFQDAVVVTVYNPAHLVRKLRAQGCHVRLLKNSGYAISCTVGNKKMSLEGFEYFQRLIQDHLVNEDVVLEVLRHAHDIVASGKVGRNSRIPFYFSQPHQPSHLNEDRQA